MMIFGGSINLFRYFVVGTFALRFVLFHSSEIQMQRLIIQKSGKCIVIVTYYKRMKLLVCTDIVKSKVSMPNI